MRGPLSNYAAPSVNFPGFYRGVVVDSEDPDGHGRCRVRVIGVHSPDLTSSSSVPVDTLDWAEQAAPIFGEGISGGGSFSVPKVGAHVFVFFEGGNYRKPVYFAYSYGIPGETYSNQKAFPTMSDPNKVDDGKSDYVNSDGKSSYDNRKTNIIKKISTGDNTSSWDEPESQKPAEYGNNIYLTSPSGVGIEMDTKVKSQRVVIQHPSGTFQEFHLEGDSVRKSAQNSYDLASCKRYIYSGGDVFDTTKGSRINYTVKDQAIQVDGNDNHEIKKKQTIKIGTDQNLTVTKNQSITVGVKQTIDVGAYQKITVVGYQEIKVGGYQEETIAGYQKLEVKGMQRVNVSGFTLHRHTGTFMETNLSGKFQTNNGSLSVRTQGTTSVVSSGIMSFTAPLIFLG